MEFAAHSLPTASAGEGPAAGNPPFSCKSPKPWSLKARNPSWPSAGSCFALCAHIEAWVASKLSCWKPQSQWSCPHVGAEEGAGPATPHAAAMGGRDFLEGMSSPNPHALVSIGLAEIVSFSGPHASVSGTKDFLEKASSASTLGDVPHCATSLEKKDVSTTRAPPVSDASGHACAEEAEALAVSAG